jgi:hypothetical protein
MVCKIKFYYKYFCLFDCSEIFYNNVFRGGLEPEDCAEALDQALDGLFNQLESVATALGAS